MKPSPCPLTIVPPWSPVVEAYDVSADRWISLPPMPTARHGLGVVVVGTVVYTIAGGTVPGLSVSDAVEVIDVSPLRL